MKPQESRDWLVGRMVGGVLIKRCIGQGGMGRVYAGRSRAHGKDVAVKVIQPGLARIEHLESLRREAMIAGLFDKEFIAAVYAAGAEVLDGREVHFLIMQLIEGARTIVDFAGKNQLTSRQRIKLFEKVCAAVGHGHGKLIVHRDLKPSNILVDRSGKPFVIDFGIARSLNPELTLLAARDRTGKIPGTYAYMSPEQFKGDPDGVDKRTDVYSLGLILYELLTGKLPYDIKDKNAGEMSRIVQYEPPVPLERRRPDLPPSLVKIVGRCLDKRPAHRHPDAIALLTALKGRQRREPITVKLGERYGKLAEGVARHRSFLAGVLTGVCIGACLMLFAQWVAGPVPKPNEPRVPHRDQETTDRPETPSAAPSPAPSADEVADTGKNLVPEPPDERPLDEVDRALNRASTWLASHQSSDGSWSFALPVKRKQECTCTGSGVYRNRYGSTAIALLPFLWRAQAGTKREHEQVVEKGIRWLTSECERKNGRMHEFAVIDEDQGMYIQAFATLALVERYRATKDRLLEQPTQQAIKAIEEAQDKREKRNAGGWKYRPGERGGDTLSTGCQLMALFAARHAEMKVDESTLEKAGKFLDAVQLENGAKYPYQGRDEMPDRTKTAVGLLCRMQLGWRADRVELRGGVDWIAEASPEEMRNPYFLFNATQLMYVMGDQDWEKWRGRMREVLLPTQQKEGHVQGSWYEGFEAMPYVREGGRLYCTALAVLTLEVEHQERLQKLRDARAAEH